MGNILARGGDNSLHCSDTYKMVAMIIYHLYSYLKVTTYNFCIFPLQHNTMPRLWSQIAYVQIQQIP